MRRHTSTLILAAAVLAAFSVRADDPTPTPTPTPTSRPAGGTSLSEVAKEKHLKGAEDGKTIVITDENLSEYADKGRVTSPTSGSSASSKRRPVRDPLLNPGSSALVPAGSSHTDERRRYWVGMYQRQLELIASIRRQIQVLDEAIPGLWSDFYAWDDPAYRDGVIKPKLDAALERREGLEQQLLEAEPRLAEIKSEARRDGAEPGWFRGISVPTPVPPTPTPQVVVN